MQFYYKETLTQIFCCEYCKFFKKIYFEKHLQTTASDLKTIFSHICGFWDYNWHYDIFQQCAIRAYTAWKVSKYGVTSGSCFPVFGLNTGKYGPE